MEYAEMSQLMSPSVNSLGATNSDSADIAPLAQECLLASAYPTVRRLHCEYHEGILILKGSVTSYFQKQVAQEAVRKSPGVELIHNSVVVAERF